MTVALVTGASRGAGRGIAIALGSHGCTVYVTGRTEKTGEHALPGTIYETADAVTAAGGRGVAVRCDHGDDVQVEALIAQIIGEQGQIDILVNNACAIHDELHHPGQFWEKPCHLSDIINVGVRSSYVASWGVAPHMVSRNAGLIIFTSSSGAAHYCMGPAYGAHKAGVDKMAFDMAVDFRTAKTKVVTASIWMGGLKTDRLKSIIADEPEKYAYLEGQLETPEFTGHLIWSLFNDPDVHAHSGQTFIGAELAIKYGLQDDGGNQPPSARDMHKAFPHQHFPKIIR